ncbi:Mitochondrial acidic protein mam33 [Tetrabaena socialis]|uniref:Mitochondrial acidic protein mam33 n=1 Tax=Tetrabaena socialis TaxID=47790 RepID=A0A2J8A4H7_9CHLO|nr:Mitochondrial acidic protein mam33 [Tetrabaena socialis]|eukprot:PNH07419.1 Mitochondrial acidic protein mam33 [Tetrabaena socialis]
MMAPMSLRSTSCGASCGSRGATSTLPAPAACLAAPSTSGRPAAGQECSAVRGHGCWNSRRAVAMQAAGRRAASSVSSSLIAVLKDEIKYEREAYRRGELLTEPPPGDFELQDERGTSAFVLSKRFGDEEIIVRVNVNDQPEVEEGDEDEADDEYGEDDAGDAPVEFQVSIGKDGDDVLIFECESDGEYININNISLESMEVDDEPGPPAYQGPIFQDLDDTLQQAFVDFLEERGVNAYLGEYIRIYAQDKATLEYQHWLGRVLRVVRGSGGPGGGGLLGA